jgi:hypothetical protein
MNNLFKLLFKYISKSLNKIDLILFNLSNKTLNKKLNKTLN